MIISTILLRIICFIIILLVIFIFERFRFPFIKICYKYIKSNSVGESIAMLIAGIWILFLLWGAAFFLSDVPAHVIVVENVKRGEVDYRIVKAIGDYRGVKVSFLETYIDNRTNCWFVLKPNHYYPKSSIQVPVDPDSISQIIKGDTIVELDKRPNYLFEGAPTSIRKGQLDSGVKWSLEIY